MRRLFSFRSVGFCLPAAAFLLLSPGLIAQIVSHIRQTHTLTCAIDKGTPEYTTLDLHGPRIAFDLELCHAVAIAVAGPDAKVFPLLLDDEASTLDALTSGRADLVPTTSLDFTNSTRPAILLGPAILLDFTALLVPSSVPDARSLAGRKICYFAETETEAILREWLSRSHLEATPFPFSEEGEMQAAFMTGNCPAVAGDLTRLADLRTSIGPASASRYKILPDHLALDPLGPAAGDPALLRIATWTYQLLLNADTLNVTRATLPAALTSSDPFIRRLLNQTQELSTPLGLGENWPVHVLRAIGSYSDLTARTLTPVLGPLPTPPVLPLR